MTDQREATEVSADGLLDGRYRLQERLGEGGMARVYRAEDTLLGREVAIKMLTGPVDDPASVERARSETAVLASVNHHALVTLLDAHVSADESSYLVLENVEGITLRERMAQGRMDARQVAQIAVDIAEGLHVAHEAGIVHRDIKPSNVLLWSSPLPGHEWRAKIADFGIACLLDSERTTSPGILMGTMAYIAPEQARGAPPAPPMDIYAFGIMLIEALTGSRPYADCDGFGTVMARLAGPPEIPTTLHAAWQGLLRGMTAILPSDRPTALEVALVAGRLATQDASSPVASEEATAAVAVEDPVAVTGVFALDSDARTVAVPAAAASAAGRPAAYGGSVRPFPGVARPSAGSARPAGAWSLIRRPLRGWTDADRRRVLLALVFAVVGFAVTIGAILWASAATAVPEPAPALIAPLSHTAVPVEDEPETVTSGTEPTGGPVTGGQPVGSPVDPRNGGSGTAGPKGGNGPAAGNGNANGSENGGGSDEGHGRGPTR